MKAVHRLEKPQFNQNNFVISTGAKRSGEICGFCIDFHADSLRAIKGKYPEANARIK